MSISQFHACNECPLCGSRNLGDHLVLDGIRIAVCNMCGFIFTRDRFSDSEINQFYSDEYNSLRHIQGQRVNTTVNVGVLRSFYPNLAEGGGFVGYRVGIRLPARKGAQLWSFACCWG